MPFVITLAEKGGPRRPVSFDQPEVTIGRSNGNELVLKKGNVSKKHARLVSRDGRVIVVDLKSTNGTYVNGKRINSPVVLKDTDRVTIGDYTFTLGDDPGPGLTEVMPDRVEWIVTLDGPEGRQQFALLGDVTVGRSSSCDIPVNHKNVGRQQMRILPFSQYVAITDLGTALGTWVNGERLVGSRRLTGSEEVVEFAAHRLWVHRPGEEPPQAAGRAGHAMGPGFKLLLRGMGSTELVPLEDEAITFGTAPTHRIRVPDLDAPATIGRLWREEEQLFLEVVIAPTGNVRVNDEVLPAGSQREVHPGDQIRLSARVSALVEISRPLSPPPRRPEVTVPRIRVGRRRSSKEPSAKGTTAKPSTARSSTARSSTARSSTARSSATKSSAPEASTARPSPATLPAKDPTAKDATAQDPAARGSSRKSPRSREGSGEAGSQ